MELCEEESDENSQKRRERREDTTVANTLKHHQMSTQSRENEQAYEAIQRQYAAEDHTQKSSKSRIQKVAVVTTF